MTMPAERLNPEPNLQALLADIASAPPVQLSGIGDDSRRLATGDAFLAVQGAGHHGLEFVDAAIESGVAAVVWDSATGDERLAKGCVPFVGVDGLAKQLGEIANRWYDWPSQALDVIAVTGTNGKTTVAFLTAQCLQRLGRTCAYIGTLGYGIDELQIDLGMTTPPCLELHKKLAEFRKIGATHTAIEVSSHALDQDRIDGLRLDAAVFTNLSRDHVDYHGDMRAYANSKARLFTDFDCDHRIVSLDCEFGQELADRCGSEVITTSTRFDRVANGRAYVFVRSVVATASGSHVAISSSWGNGELDIPLPGEFNISNAIEVLALLLASGIEFDDAREIIGQMSAPPGRMQPVTAADEAGVPQVFVDYAHTPAALEAALRALRPHADGHIWCVFGCGGDRDHGKRSMMGKVANRLADRSIVTNDNPRSEPPQDIIADVLTGMNNSAIAIENRAAAIAYAIREAQANDTVLIAGKGHESYQIIGAERLEFSDFQTARANIEVRLRNWGRQ